MSYDYANKIRAASQAHHLILRKDKSPTDDISAVRSLSGDMLYLKNKQINDSFGSMAFSKISPIGSYSTAISSQGKIDIQLRPGTAFGKCDRAYLEITLDCVSTTQRLLPVQWWFNKIEFLSKSNTILQTLYPYQLFANLACLPFRDFRNLAEAMNIGKDFLYSPTDSIVANESKTYLLPLDDWLVSINNMFIPGIDDCILRFHFDNSTNFMLSGTITNLTISAFNLILEQTHRSASENAKEMILYKEKIHDLFFPFYIYQPISTSTLAASTTYTTTLTSINGFIGEIVFSFRASTAAASQMVFQPLTSFEILDESGVNILGGSTISDIQARSIVYPTYYDSEISEVHHIYRIPFSDDTLALNRVGVISGGHYMEGRHQLRYTTSPTAVDNVQTCTISGTADAGSFQLAFRGYITDPIAFDATVGTIATAVENLPPFRDTNSGVTISAQISSGTSFTITIDSGFLSGRPIYDKFTFINAGTLLDGATVLTGSFVNTTVGSFGWTSSTYTLDMMAVVSHRLRVDKGRMTAYTT